ncbi:MAG: S16 family serine protease, partial [Acidobacteriota bacterium]|nr:S16 family serine protease [Acidobacteriota bacterium]
GEITLRGTVLPVGGVKEKVLAARRSGLRTVILPEANRKNLGEIPRALRRNMTFVFVQHVREVFESTLIRPKRSGAVVTRETERAASEVHPTH